MCSFLYLFIFLFIFFLKLLDIFINVGTKSYFETSTLSA